MGRVYRPEYNYKRPDGSREHRQLAWYYVEYRDALGKTRRRKAAPTLGLAREILRRQEDEVAKEKAGLPVQDASRVRLLDLSARYLAFQKSRVVPGYLKALERRLEEALVHTRAVTVRDLTPERVEAFLAALEAKPRPPAAPTVNLYLQALKGMLSWAVTLRILPYNPLACIRPRPRLEKRRNRRALSEEELGRLFEAARRGPLVRDRKRYGGLLLSEKGQAEALARGERNVLIYRMLTFTGLRVGELRALRWSDLDLEAGLLRVRAEVSKNGREASLDLPLGLQTELGRWRDQPGRPPGEGVVIEVPRLLKTFNEDLALAGIPKRDTSGRTVDLHCLRHTYGTLLIKAGADIKTVQTLMRHSTPSLTLGIYVHHDRGRMREAVASLPALEPTASKLAPLLVAS